MNQALEFLSEQLNAHLKSLFGLDDDQVIVGRLINQDGTIPSRNQNKLVVSFVSLSQEKTTGSYDTRMGFAASGTKVTEAPMHYNLQVVLGSVFDDDQESLKFLSKAVEFFHANTYFDKSSHPNLPKDIAKINLEMCSLSLPEFDALWSGIGAKAVPSALYKIRVLSINNDTVNTTTPPISSTDINEA